MMAISRALFIKAALVGLAATGGASALTGCGSGAAPNNAYRGTYRSYYTIPSSNEGGTFSFTVEQKGSMTGSFTDDATNKVMSFSGGMGNNGSFNGNVTDSGGTYQISGTVASVSGTTPTSALPAAIVGGDFHITRNNMTIPGTFVVGGTAASVASIYSAAYSNGDFPSDTFDASSLPAGTLPSSQYLIFDVDNTGAFLGILGQNQFSGTITNGNHITGTITTKSGGVYPFHGIINKQTLYYNTSVNGVPTPKTFPGVSASLLITSGGVDYPANLIALGGTG